MIGIPVALTTAAVGMVLAIALTWRFKLGHHEVLDFRPSMDWPLPVLAETPEPDVPVMVTIEYRIQPDKRAEFVAAMQDVREMRRRNGAYFWQLFHDSEDPTRFVECFMDESWLEHLRQHERVSVADREIQRARKAVSRRRRNDEILALARRSRILTFTCACTPLQFRRVRATCGSRVRRSLLYIFLIDEESSTDAGKNITGNITQKGPPNLANPLILAPRPGLEPGTCGLLSSP